MPPPMIELVPPVAPSRPAAEPKGRPVVVRIRPTIRYPAFLLQNQRAAELIRGRWGELAMHSLFAQHAPGANPETHGFTVAEHGALSWVDWVEHRRQPSPRLSSWFHGGETWQALPPEEGLAQLMRAAGRACLEHLTDTLEALGDATGLTALLPGAFGAFAREASLGPEHLEHLAALVRAPRAVGDRLEFAAHYRGRVGLVSLDVVRASARLETSFEVPALMP